MVSLILPCDMAVKDTYGLFHRYLFCPHYLVFDQRIQSDYDSVHSRWWLTSPFIYIRNLNSITYM